MQEIYQHFRKDEQTFIDQVLEWKEQVETQYAFKLIDFLDPREQSIVQAIVGQSSDVLLSFWGGQDEAERKRAMIYPTYFLPEEKDYEVTIFEIIYPVKFVKIEHPKVLGTLMSLGLKRQKFGDIFISNDRIQFVVASEIADYVEMNLTSVGKVKIQLKKVAKEDVIQIENKWDMRSGTSSSLRLDALLSEIYKVSRQKILPYIQNGHVKVNWKITESPSYECKEGDHFSVRGLGRSKLDSIEGLTKKEKWRINIGVQK